MSRDKAGRQLSHQLRKLLSGQAQSLERVRSLLLPLAKGGSGPGGSFDKWGQAGGSCGSQVASKPLGEGKQEWREAERRGVTPLGGRQGQLSSAGSQHGEVGRGAQDQSSRMEEGTPQECWRGTSRPGTVSVSNADAELRAGMPRVAIVPNGAERLAKKTQTLHLLICMWVCISSAYYLLNVTGIRRPRSCSFLSRSPPSTFTFFLPQHPGPHTCLPSVCSSCPPGVSGAQGWAGRTPTERPVPVCPPSFGKPDICLAVTSVRWARY